MKMHSVKIHRSERGIVGDRGAPIPYAVPADYNGPLVDVRVNVWLQSGAYHGQTVRAPTTWDAAIWALETWGLDIKTLSVGRQYPAPP